MTFFKKGKQRAAGDVEKKSMLCGFFDQIKGRYQEVMQHIRSAEKLGTTKSAMFEDIDNVMSQIPQIIDDYTSDK